eukprot:m.194159 g.194159  ORF g.194159 m.194159 type:complete len:64 (-) comp16787_c9_seq2:1983-2174(-)
MVCIGVCNELNLSLGFQQSSFSPVIVKGCFSDLFPHRTYSCLLLWWYDLALLSFCFLVSDTSP